MSNSYVVKMPVPVSANQRLIRTSYGTLTNSNKYRNWFNSAYFSITKNKVISPICNRVAIKIIVHFKDNRRRDLDNILKGFQDVCTKAKYFLDDAQIDSLAIYRGKIDRKKQGYLIAKIKEI